MNALKGITAITATTLALVASSCSDNDEPSLSVFQNIVTYMGNSSDGARFEFQEADDSPIVSLGVKARVKEDKVKPGERLLMLYSLPSGFSYGQNCSEVKLLGLQSVYTDTITPLPHSDAITKKNPIYISTIYRSGHYLNITAKMPATANRTYSLVADDSTLDDGDVHAYLTSDSDDDKPTFNETQTASIDISPVWSMPQTKSLTVHFNNTNNKYLTSVTFTKNNIN